MKCLTWAQLEQEPEGCCAEAPLEGQKKIGDPMPYMCTRRKFHVGPHHTHTFDKCLIIWRDPEVEEAM